MKKFMILILCSSFSYLSSDDEDFSYTYLELSAVQAENTGYNVTASLGLPLSLYLKGSLNDKEIDLNGDVYQKSGSVVSIGTHVSVADLLKNVTKDGFSFNFARFMDFYAELGANKWELEDLLGKQIEMLTYPHGKFNKKIKQKVFDKGYKLAFSSKFGVNKKNQDKLALNRSEIWSTDEIEIFNEKLEGSWDWLKFRNL